MFPVIPFILLPEFVTSLRTLLSEPWPVLVDLLIAVILKAVDRIHFHVIVSVVNSEAIEYFYLCHIFWNHLSVPLGGTRGSFVSYMCPLVDCVVVLSLLLIS